MSFRTRSLKAKLHVVLLVPFVVLSLVSLYGLEQVIGTYGQFLTDRRGVTVEAVGHHLEEAVLRLQGLAHSFAKPREIAAALAAADNELLSDWALSFIGEADTIFFLDGDGLVLARQPDEFRFGDDLGDRDFFQQACATGDFVGPAVIDGRRALLVCRPVGNDRDETVGYVAVARFVTASFLESFVHLPDVALVDGGPGLEEGHRVPLETPFGALALVFFEDKGYRDLRELRHFLLLAGLAVSAGTFLFLLLFLERQFVPYRQIVSSLGAYAGKTLTLDGLYERMAVLRRDRSSEVGAIAEGVCAMIALVQSNVAQIEDYAAQLRDLAERDELTGLWNRRYLDRTLAVEVERSSRYGSPLSVVMIDLDHFKRVNDDYGHPVGDFVLASMGRFLREQSRATDFPGRWGGEEFLIVCPAISGNEALRFAQRLRRALEGTSFRPELFLTASFGVAQLRLGEAVHEMVARADGALYQAKAGGRNRVVVSSGQS